MTVRRRTLLIVAGALAGAGCSTTSAPPPPSVAVSGASSETGASRAAEITVTATVERVDHAQRLVTLRGPDGGTETIRADNRVRNLPQVKRGDEVVVTYYQAVAFEVVPPGQAELGVSADAGAARAALGAKPGGVVAEVVTIVADIVKLDRANSQAVLRGKDGETMTVDVRNPANFDKVKVGDRVEITVAEAIAIDVQPAPAKR